MAGIGAKLRLDKDGRMVVAGMSARGTARSSGMIHEGDAILKVDKQWTDGMSLGDVEALLHGAPDSLVKIKYARGAQEMTVTLTRETGNEHVLHHEHHLGGAHKMTPAEEEDMMRRQQAENIYHGIEEVNKERHRHEEAKMTKEELEAYKARRKAEDEENYRQSEAFYAKQVKRDQEEAAKEAALKEGQKRVGMMGAAANMVGMGGHHQPPPQQQKQGGWHMPHFGHQSTSPPPKEKEGSWHMPHFGRRSEPKPPPPQRAWYDFSPQTDAERKQKDERAKANLLYAAAGYQANKMEKKWEQTVRKDNKVDRANCFDFGNAHANSKKKEHSGEHEWPWQVRHGHDDKWLDHDVSVPFVDDWEDFFFRGKKKQQQQRR